MRNLLVKRFSTGSWGLQSNSSLPFLLSYRRNAASGTVAEEEAGVSYGLNRALARMGVFVKGKAFRNLSTYELQQHGATTPECLSGIPLHIRGNVSERASGISKTQFNKLLKQVTSHISSISNVFVHDVAIGSSPKCDAKVRVISDGPSPVLSLSNILWNTSARAISHDSCPLTVYVATSINQGMVGDIIGLGSGGTNGFVASDIDRLSLVLCGRAFSDTSGIKQALSALSGPIIAARGGLPLSASCDIVPSVSRLSPGQAAYHFLAGYQNGNFVPVYNRGPSSIDPLELAKALLSKIRARASCTEWRIVMRQHVDHVGWNGTGRNDPRDYFKLEEDHIPSFLVNVSDGQKSLTGRNFIKLVETTLSKDIPLLQTIGLKRQSKAMAPPKTVCVMDASGHLGSALVYHLLHRGYTVHATLQSHGDLLKPVEDFPFPSNTKKLKVFRSDLLDYYSIIDTLKDCSALLYCFEPPPDHPSYDEFMAEMEVRAAHNVLEACAQTESIEKVVFTSSVTAVIWKDDLTSTTTSSSSSSSCDLDERNWSDINFCKKLKLWHGLSKTLAEKTAWALAMDRGLNMVSINGGLLMGPQLTITNPYLKGAAEMYENGVLVTVDLKFVVDAHICVLEDTSAFGRYLCFDRVINCHQVALELTRLQLPPTQSPTPLSFVDTTVYQQRISNKKLNKLMVHFDKSPQLHQSCSPTERC